MKKIMIMCALLIGSVSVMADTNTVTNATNNTNEVSTEISTNATTGVETYVTDVEVYQFKSTLKTYSITKKKYISTSFNGTMTIKDGIATIEAIKKDTKEPLVLTTSVISNVYSMIAGKKLTVGATYMTGLMDKDNTLLLNLSGYGTAKTKVTGCTPCGDSSVCTKIKTLSGTLIGVYFCGCDSDQYYSYNLGECDFAETPDLSECPVSGTWKATLKYVNGVKYK